MGSADGDDSDTGVVPGSVLAGTEFATAADVAGSAGSAESPRHMRATLTAATVAISAPMKMPVLGMRLRVGADGTGGAIRLSRTIVEGPTSVRGQAVNS